MIYFPQKADKKKSQPDHFACSAGAFVCGKLITSSLENIAKEIERDLEQGLRDNDYIRDENADNLRAALKQLERCGVRCYSLEKRVDDLAWFVGGDPDKIRQLQQKLNELGIGERLKEDGVFGAKTRKAMAKLVQNIVDYVAAFLTDPRKVRVLDEAIAFAYEIAEGPFDAGIDVYDINKQVRQAIQRFVWEQGAEHYLRKNGYRVAAL